MKPDNFRNDTTDDSVNSANAEYVDPKKVDLDIKSKDSFPESISESQVSESILGDSTPFTQNNITTSSNLESGT